MNSTDRPFVQFTPGGSGSGAPQGPVKRTVNLTVVLAILLLLVVMSVGIGIGAGATLFVNMYRTLLSPDELQSVQPALVSKVYGRDGSLIHEFSIERRFWVNLDQIPVELRRAVVAIEDRRFYEHWGVDIYRIFGAAVANVVKGGIAQGGSTITQQLARNLYLTFRQSLVRKIREAMTAVQMEKYYTKEQILELYLNQVYLGSGCYGVEAASQRYFSKPVSELDLNECATMAGIIQLPEHYRPDKAENRERVTRRRNVVLGAMREMGFIQPDQARQIAATGVPANPQKATAVIAPYFVEMVRDYLEKKYGEKMLYNGGLTIHTTLDPVAQAAAEDTLAIHLRWLQQKANRIFLDYSQAHRHLRLSKEQYLERFDSLYALDRPRWKALPDSQQLRIVQGAVIALDNRSGGILSLVGGRDFAESKFNRALQALRQPGSAFKPFVYTAAIDSSYTAASVVLDQPITLETPEGLWRPQNYDGQFNGPMTIRNALRKSINLVAIQVIRDIGEMKVVELARRMGLKNTLAPVPSLAIGSCEATVMEITRAYSIYPNGGRLVQPYYIERVVDKNDRVLERHQHREESILQPQTAFVMTSLMRSVVTAGTAAAIPGMGFNRPAGGKTGTTNDCADAWFVGFTPQVTCGVWVGTDERRTMGYGVTGSIGSVPVWVKAMKVLHRNLPAADFQQPPGIVSETLCSKSNKLATPACGQTYHEIFIEGTSPVPCDIHGRSRGSDTQSDVLRLFGTQKKKPVTDNKKTKKKLMF